MSEIEVLIGQFLVSRERSPDTPEDPYDPLRESPIELIARMPGLAPKPAVKAQLPLPPEFIVPIHSLMSSPQNVVLSTPSPSSPPLSFEPATGQTNTLVISPTLIYPSRLPPPLVPEKTSESSVPFPPKFVEGHPSDPVKPVNVELSKHDDVPNPPKFVRPEASFLAPPADVALAKPSKENVAPDFKQTSGYSIDGDTYSPMIGVSDPGSLAGDPVLYERHLERLARLGPEKLIVHAMTQKSLFALNTFGNIWNPALIAPVPGNGDLLLPALDLPAEGTAQFQIQVGSLVDEVLNGRAGSLTSMMDTGQNKMDGQPRLARMKKSDDLVKAFDGVRNSLANGSSVGSVDRLTATAFADGIIPMRTKGENDLGFTTFRKGRGDQIDDDDMYLPLSFTDLRPIGDTYRTVYFRPLIRGLRESLSPQWNETNYMGRVDAVATYQSTARNISIDFALVAFGPEDVVTIWQKLHWLSSMVYPEYDNNLVMTSGPVVRLHIGDVFNSNGQEGSKGMPGIIKSLDFDYSEALWELKKDFKLPRNIEVSMTFTVLHDVPVGRGKDGKFGGLGTFDASGNYLSTIIDNMTGKNVVPVGQGFFRRFGDDSQLDYDKITDV
jgi:hypothetical protein